MFRVKICGVTRPRDAQLAAQAGADAIGLNFYPLSKRRLDSEQARRIIQSSPRELLKVGVFVNAGVEEILRIVEACRLDAVQLHGDETTDLVEQLATLPVIRALRLGRQGWGPLAAQWIELSRCEHPPSAVLIDADAGDAFGGQGLLAPWDQIPAAESRPPTALILAGGLTSTNVGAGVAAVAPFGVDVASGVEEAPGVKSQHLVREFVRAARQALQKVGSN